MNRRSFVAHSLIGAIPFFFPVKLMSQLLPSGSNYFIHGIASGDPTNTAVVVWTRINETVLEDCRVEWQISSDRAFKNIVKSEFFTTSFKRDYTVKVDIINLESDSLYYYRFMYNDTISEIGTCRTLAEEIDIPVKIAVVSCNNYEDGFFTSFRHIADNPEVDYVFHLGDYIYEYGTEQYANKEFVKTNNRVNDPIHEIVTLADYRKRYALYRRDKDLQKAHQQKSFYCIWDDHELANNAYATGAKNHQENEGEWKDRSDVAMQAYFEWMPVRANSLKEMVRSIRIGDTASFYFLEERLEGRDKQLFSGDIEKFNPQRTMISPMQLDWLTDQLESSDTRWNFLVNQVMFTGYENAISKYDKEDDWWTGYPEQRNQLIRVFENLKNPPIILTGDHHQSHVLELHATDMEKAKTPIAWEFLTPSITSKNDDRLTTQQVEEKKEELYRLNPHLIYNNTADHGYFIMEIAKEEIAFRYHFSSNILVQDSEEKQGPVFKINHLNQLTKDV